MICNKARAHISLPDSASVNLGQEFEKLTLAQEDLTTLEHAEKAKDGKVDVIKAKVVAQRIPYTLFGHC